jgi:branched-chain amino acid transport system ATP-binding protein
VLLELDAATVHYGKVQALKAVSLTVDEGEIVALIGSNGAGKTTTLRAISGIRSLSSGALRFQGEDISRMPAHQRVERGISQVPEGRKIFPGMTVFENLEMGSYGRRSVKKAQLAADFERVFSLFPHLAERRSQAGGTLSGGEQQMLAIGRALMARPQLLLLDEPSMGLAPKLVEQIFQIITEINKQGTTILLVEQNAAMALQHAERAYVLQSGLITKSDEAAKLLNDEAVRTSYLGM